AANPGSGGRVIQPQPGGPSFRVFANFDVIKRYNNSDSYAIGVGHLADRIAGGGPLKSSFPPDASGLTKADRQELQRRLTAAGFDAGGSDGVIGPKTRAAISGWQRRRGLPVTGEPSPDLLAQLRRGGAGPPRRSRTPMVKAHPTCCSAAIAGARHPSAGSGR